MARRWWLGLVMALCGVMAQSSMVSLALAEDDAVAQLRTRLTQTDPAEVVDAVADADSLGPAAVVLMPEILRLLKADDLTVRLSALELLEQWGPAAEPAVPQLVALLDDASLIVKHGALMALQAIGPDPAVAGPRVIRLLKDQESFIRVDAATSVLAWNLEARAAAIDALKSALSDERASVRTAAAQGLRLAGADAVPALKEAFASGSPATKTAAADALGDLGAVASPAIPELIAALEMESPVLRAVVVRALGEIGAQPEQVLPKLKLQCACETAQVRVAALEALGRFGSRAASETSTLSDALNDPDLSVRLAACDALAAIGPESRSAIESLSLALKDSEGVVTLRAAEALGRMGSAAIPALVKLLDQRDYSVLALQTLESMGPSARPAVAKMVDLLKEDNDISKRSLCLAIAAIGADPKVAGPALKQVLANEKSDARPAAAYALGRIGDHTAIKELTNAIEADDPLLRLATAWSLLHLDPQNVDYIKIAVPRLIEALDRPEPSVRLQAARALGELGSYASPAMPALVKTLGHDDVPMVRIAAAMAVSRLGSVATPAIPGLLSLAESPDADGRRAAIYALGSMGPAATSAVPTLKSIIASGLPGERVVAAWSILQIQHDPATLETALPIVLEGMAAERPEAVVQLIRLASRVGSRRPEVRKVLTELLDSDDPALRAAAAAGLDRLN